VTEDELRHAFQARFGSVPRVSRAPGRVNLIGEHTDYNQGFVLPLAIELVTRVAFAATDGAHLVVHSTAFEGDPVEIPLGGTHANHGHWSDHVWAVLQALEEDGVTVPSAALLIDSDVPVGSGLGSSAALEVAAARALLSLARGDRSPEEVALLCQRAENDFVGVRCGIMDPLIACLGREGRAMLLDCRSREASFVWLPPGLEIVIVDTGVHHSLAAGEYNRRRDECESAVAILAHADPAICSLRDLTPSSLEDAAARLDPRQLGRARHVVTENARVLDFVAALEAGDLARAGRLLAESQRSLREDYEVSCAELDLLVELARAQPALVGARMTGGGFGGCTVNLVRAGQGREFSRSIAADYQGRTGRLPEVWTTGAGGGATID